MEVIQLPIDVPQSSRVYIGVCFGEERPPGAGITVDAIGTPQVLAAHHLMRQLVAQMAPCRRVLPNSYGPVRFHHSERDHKFSLAICSHYSSDRNVHNGNGALKNDRQFCRGCRTPPYIVSLAKITQVVTVVGFHFLGRGKPFPLGHKASVKQFNRPGGAPGRTVGRGDGMAKLFSRYGRVTLKRAVVSLQGGRENGTDKCRKNVATVVARDVKPSLGVHLAQIRTNQVTTEELLGVCRKKKRGTIVFQAARQTIQKSVTKLEVVSEGGTLL